MSSGTVARGAALLAGNGIILNELFQALRSSDAILASWEMGTRLVAVVLSFTGVYNAYRMLMLSEATDAAERKDFRSNESTAMACFAVVAIVGVLATPLMNQEPKPDAAPVSALTPGQPADSATLRQDTQE